MSSYTDNTNKMNLSDENRKNIAEMKVNAEKVEQILKNVGTILPLKCPMWFTGIVWVVKMEDFPVYLKVEYSDKRFEVQAIRVPNETMFDGNYFLKNSENVFIVCSYMQFIDIEKLDGVLVNFYNLFTD